MQIFNTVEELIVNSHDLQPISGFRIGDILLEAQVIDQDQLEKALRQQKKQLHLRLGVLIVQLNFATEQQVQQALMRKFGIPIIRLSECAISLDMQTILPGKMQIAHQIVPLALVDNRLYLAMFDPFDWKVTTLVSEQTGYRVEPVMATSSDIQAKLRQEAPVSAHTDLPKEVDSVFRLLPHTFLEQYQVMPLLQVDNRLYLAMIDTDDETIANRVTQQTGLLIEPVLVIPAQLHALIQSTYAITDVTPKTDFNVPDSTHFATSDDKSMFLADPKRTTASRIGVDSIIKDRFLLTEILGEGGMGTVYKAIDKRKQEAFSNDYYVAIKLLNHEFKDHTAFITMEREASKTQKLYHPNIVFVKDFDRDGDHIYIVMEYLEGQPLNEYINKHHEHGLPVNKALDILKPLAMALDYAHQKNLVHCDFKPNNAFITNDNIVKVIDFGIARVSSAISEKSHTHIIDDQIVNGCTPAYATHEIIMGKAPLPCDDVYALACTAYKLITGKHPFQGHSPIEAERLGLSAQPIKSLSRRQWQGLRRGLSFSRQERMHSTIAFLQAITTKRKRYSPIALFLLLLFMTGTVLFQTLPFWETRQANRLMARIEANALSDAELVARYYSDRFHPVFTTQIRRSIRTALVERIILAEENDLHQQLSLMQRFSDPTRVEILATAAVRLKLMQYYNKQMNITRNTDQHHRITAAQRMLDTAKNHYPTSKQLAHLQHTLQSAQNTLRERYAQRLRSAFSQAVPDLQNTTTLLANLQMIDPQHLLLQTTTGGQYFETHIRLAMNARNTRKAQALFEVLKRFWPDYPQLIQLRAIIAFGALDHGS